MLKPELKRKRANIADSGTTLTVDQAWRMVGMDNITRQAMYLAAARGDFPSIRLGRRILIPRLAFEAWLTGTKPSPIAG